MNLRDEWRERVAEALSVANRPDLSGAAREAETETWLPLADALLAPGGVVAGIVAEAEIAGQMKHITAEVARGDVSLSESEEIIAALRARVSHAEAERDEAFRRAPNMGAAVYERGKRDGAADVRARVEAVDFTVRRLGTATGDPWVGGWNDALAVCQDDLRLALDAPISAPVRRSEPLSGSGEGASTPDVSRGRERGEG